jgi:deazaflavin-dependent oxidoreductase (nitroreductase family)
MALPAVPPPGSLRLKLFSALTQLNVHAYRLSGGWVGGRFGRARVLLLHHVGRKSGKHRVSPLLYLRDGERLAIVASAGGRRRHPAWWLNLRESPRTTVEVGRGRHAVTARQATPEERAELWPRLVAIWPDYAAYQERCEREIPVILLEPA